MCEQPCGTPSLRGVPLFARLGAEVDAIFHSGSHKGLSRPQVELQALLNLFASPAASAGASPADDDRPPAATTRRRSSTKKLCGLVRARSHRV